MPTYEYACTSCGEHVEAVQSFSDDPLTTCPACGGTLRKVFAPVGIVLKGSGFYKTDSRTASGAKAGDGRSDGDGGSSSSSEGAAKADGTTSTSGDGAKDTSAGSGSSGSSGGGKGADSGGSSGSSSPAKAASTSG
jgi:putative FmdB family regulatory protein